MNYPVCRIRTCTRCKQTSLVCSKCNQSEHETDAVTRSTVSAWVGSGSGPGPGHTQVVNVNIDSASGNN